MKMYRKSPGKGTRIEVIPAGRTNDDGRPVPAGIGQAEFSVATHCLPVMSMQIANAMTGNVDD